MNYEKLTETRTYFVKSKRDGITMSGFKLLYYYINC